MAFWSVRGASYARLITVAAAFVLAVPAAHALSIGRLNIQSALGQPFRAEIELTSVSAEEAASLAVRVAPPAAFRAARLEYNPALTGLRVRVEPAGGDRFRVRVDSPAPVDEPYIDLLLEFTWTGGQMSREFTVLLDPPALRGAPDVIAPAAGVAAPAAAPAAAAVVVPVPAPTQTAAAPAPAPVVAAPRATARRAAPESVTVKRGDTLGAIAQEVLPAGASLDQALVALFRANPSAFAERNMNRLNAGAVLRVPDAAEVTQIGPQEARTEVLAQSRDFAAFRSRLAGAAAAAPAVAPPTGAAQGRVTARVDDKTAPPAAADQLKIARADAAGAAAKSDESAALRRALKEQEERVAELSRLNDTLRKALEVQSRTAAQAQQAVAAKAEPAPAPANSATAPAAPEAAKAAAADPPKAGAPEPGRSEPAKTAAEAEVAKGAAGAAAAPPVAASAEVKAEPKAEAKAEPKAGEAKSEPKAAAKAAPAPAPAAEAPGLLESVLESTLTRAALGVLVLVLLGILGLNAFRRRREAQESTRAAAASDGSLFDSVGGRNVDTGATTTTFSSTFISGASQIDSNEVDPVAEADVYLAYGKEDEAVNILKESLKQQPDRLPVRKKLLEIFGKRTDKTAFRTLLAETHARTGGVGPDWEATAEVARLIEPRNPLLSDAMGVPTVPPGTVGPKTGVPAAKGGTVPFSPAAAAGAPTRPGPVAPARSTIIPVGAGSAGPATVPQPAPQTRPRTGAASGPATSPATVPAATATTLAAPATERGDLTAAGLVPLDGETAAAQAAPVVPTAQTTPRAAAPALAAAPAPAPTVPAPAVAAVPSAAAGGALAGIDFDLDIPAPAPTAVVTAAEEIGATEFDFGEPLTEIRPRATTGTGAMRELPDVDLELFPSTAPVDVGDGKEGPDTFMERWTTGIDGATAMLKGGTAGAEPGLDLELGGAAGAPASGTRAAALASQMATKLDLARGYIDLGVRDGARELLEEVLRDGTLEQRRAAVELMKSLEG